MTLHWFREHKNIVYWVLLPGVGIGLMFLGLTDRSGKSLPTGSAPSIQYTVGNTSYELSPTQVLQLRNAFYGVRGVYDPQRGNKDEDNASSYAIGYLMAEVETARQQGFEVGKEEFNDAKRNIVIQKIKQLDRMDRDKEVKLTPEMYEKLLAQLNLSSASFDSMVHDLILREKYRNSLRFNLVEADPAQYSKYAQKEENARIRYMTFKSEAFFDKTAMPTDEQIKAFYDGKKTQHMYDGSTHDTPNKELYKDIFMTDPTLSLEALFYKDEKAFENLGKAQDYELQQVYDRQKFEKWKDPAKEGTFKPFESVKAEVEKEWKEYELNKYYALHKTRNWPDPDPAKPGQFKPFESVRAEVEKLWQEDRPKTARDAAKSNMMLHVSSMLSRDLATDEAKFKADLANKDKPFDIKAWAAAHKFEYWTTQEHTEDKYKDGKLEVKGEHLPMGTLIFNYSRPPARMPASALESWKKHMDEFTSLNWLDVNKPELGGIAARKHKFSEARLKTLEEAKPKIIEFLRTQESVKLAKTAADELRDKLSKIGKDDPLPKWDEYEELTSEKKEYHPLVNQLKETPRAVGQVMDVATGGAERDEKDKEKDMGSIEIERKWHYVGVVVERKLPSMAGFKKAPDSEWNRSQQRQMARSYDGVSAMLAMIDPIHASVQRIGANVADPDLRTVFSKGDE